MKKFFSHSLPLDPNEDVKTNLRKISDIIVSIQDWANNLFVDVPDLPSTPGCILWNSSPQTLPDALITPLTFDTVSDFTDLMFDKAQNDRIKITKTGFYHVYCCLFFVGNAAGVREILFERGTSGVLIGRQGKAGNAAAVATFTLGSIVRRFQAGEVIRINAFQNTGGNLDTIVTGSSTNPESPVFGIHWLGN